MGAGLIDDFTRNNLFIPFCPYHFVHTILSNTILSVYHFVHTILSVPFCPLPFCPRTVCTSLETFLRALMVVKALAEGPPWALREVDRLTMQDPKGWPTKEAGVGRTPGGEGGPNGPTGFLTLPGEEWSPPGIGPRNLNMCDRHK